MNTANSGIFGLRSSVAGAALVFLTSSAAQSAPFFMGLGDLSGGGFKSQAYEISADGSTVVGSSDTAAGQEAFRWTIGRGMQGIGDFAGGNFSSRALDVSADGSVVVGQGSAALGGGGPFTGSVDVPFRWTESVGLEALGSGEPFSSATGVSADGTVIVGGAGGAVRWSLAGNSQNLGSLGGSPFFDGARGVSADGTIVVGVSGGQPFRWTDDGGMQSLGPLEEGPFNSANGISADGTVIIGGDGQQAFRWVENGEIEALGDLGGRYELTSASDLSADGSFIVGNGYFSTYEQVGSQIIIGAAYEAFLWDEVHGMRVLKDVLVGEFGLDLTGWTLQ